MTNAWSWFWGWYERNYVLNVSIALGLFLLQLWHLAWLGGDVISPRLGGEHWFGILGVWQFLTIVVDYTEIPAIIAMSLVYVDSWRLGNKWNAAVMLLLLNIQWLHIFWITDEFTLDVFARVDVAAHGTMLPAWLAWVAISIDYLEVPVIADTAYKLFFATRHGRAGEFLKHDFRS